MTIPRLLYELIDRFCLSNTGATLVALGLAGSESTGSKFMMCIGAVRRAWLRLMEPARRGERTEQERYLAASGDRFEVERRERAWNREQERDGSLLGW
jgi:hypothetical protein